MVSYLFVLVGLVALAVALALLKLFSGGSSSSKGAAAAQDPCWVCGSDALKVIEDRVYECRHCRNVQGARASDYRNAQRRAAYLDLVDEK